MTDIDALLTERKTTHGEYSDHARYSQSIKDIIRSSPNWLVMEPHQKETLEMVAHKIARILTGDHAFDDHWKDMAGYSKLSADRLVR